MRTRVVLHYLGLLIAVIGLTMLLPLGWSLFNSDGDAPAFAISMAISLGVGLLLWRLLPVTERGMNRREAILLVAGGWISASLFGALPYFLSGALPGFLNAYFEAMSGYTATGATVFTSIETQTQSILLWRNLTQWLGGMGIITLFVALFPVLGIGAAYLVEAEMAGLQTEKLTVRIRDTAKAVWMIYIGFSVLEAIALLVAGLPFFEAITVTFGTMATGGFTPTNLSIGSYNSPLVEGIVIFFMIIAATNFGMHYLILWKRQFSSLFKNDEFRFYLSILAAACLIVSLDLFYNMGSSITDALRFGVFNTVSIGTTTGFATTDFNAWPSLSRAVLLILMLIGGSAGSTAGGIKTVRLLVSIKYIYRRIITAFNPKAVIPVRVGNTILSERMVSGFIGMVLLYLATVIFAFLSLSAIGLDPVTAISAVLTNMATVGPGLGLVGPMENYYFIPPVGKGIIIFCQLAGRLELFTLLMLFTPAFWRWR
jgi:trk system potassium uptake protein TrkH